VKVVGWRKIAMLAGAEGEDEEVVEKGREVWEEE
jgi:hypothetical protein